jgi:hypothetical protein
VSLSFVFGWAVSPLSLPRKPSVFRLQIGGDALYSLAAGVRNFPVREFADPRVANCTFASDFGPATLMLSKLIDGILV